MCVQDACESRSHNTAPIEWFDAVSQLLFIVWPEKKKNTWLFYVNPHTHKSIFNLIMQPKREKRDEVIDDKARFSAMNPIKHATE